MPAPGGLALRLLGPLQVRVGGVPADLPPSRKVRALLAYLALVGRPVSRGHLCELLWDLPSDPRGELRWALSKLRISLGSSGETVVASGESVALQLPEACVDALEVAHALQQGIATLPIERLQHLARLLASGDLLEKPGSSPQPRVHRLARGRTAALPCGARFRAGTLGAAVTG
jgi:DNA-binding SARP family transcriptional activator